MLMYVKMILEGVEGELRMTFKKSLLLLMTIAAALSSNGKTREIASADKGKAVTVNQIFAGPWSACLDERLSPEIVRSNSIRDFRMTSIKPDENGRIDFTVIRKNIPVRSKAAAFREIESDSEQTIMLGFLCDWWGALYLNGEPVFDCLKTGSGKVQSIYGRPLKCTLKKGKNVFAVFLMAGSLGCSFNIGFLPDRIKLDEAALPDVISYFYKEPRELHSLPWISDTGTDAVTIKVAAKSLCSAAIQYQEAESGEKAVILENACWGQSVLAKFHQIRLTSLKPGTRYQYFLLLRWKDSEDAVQKLGPFYFRTFPEVMKEHTILFTADTQTIAREQKKIFSLFAEKGLLRGGDLFIHLGDVQNSFSNFSKQFAGTFLASFQPYAGTELPIMITRGNHEFRGEESLSFAEVAGKPYEAFVMGDVFYLKLDSGWDVDATKSIQWRDHTEDYMKEQKIWLEKTVASDAWKKARCHVVLCHATPCYDFSPFVTRNIQMLAGDLFLGKNPREKIDLWICGHTHCAARFDVKTQKFQTAGPRKHCFFFDEQKKYMVQKPGCGYPMDYICIPFDYVPFPIVVMDGPEGAKANLSLMRLNSNPNGIFLKHYNASGDLIDDIEIVPNHEFKVIGTKMRPVTEQQAKLR